MLHETKIYNPCETCRSSDKHRNRVIFNYISNLFLLSLSYYFAALVIHPTACVTLHKGPYLHPVWVNLPLQNIRVWKALWLQQELLLSLRDKYLISKLSEHLIFLQLHLYCLGHSSQSLNPKLCDSEWLIAMNITANSFKSKRVAPKVCTIWARFLLAHLWGFGLFVLVEWLSGFLFIFPVQDVWNYVRSVLQPNRANVLKIATNFHPRKV